MTRLAKFIFLLWFAALTPVKTFACATCYGADIDSSLAEGMNLGILTLLAFTGTVLACALGFLIYVIRRSEALTAAAEAATESPKV